KIVEHPDLDPPPPGILDQRAFLAFGRPGDEKDFETVPKRLAGQDRVLLGAAGDQPRDDMVDDRLRHSSSDEVGLQRGFPSYFTSTSVNPFAGTFAPAFVRSFASSTAFTHSTGSAPMPTRSSVPTIDRT